MDANQRSEVNNQTNNGANEKWTPGAKGNTTNGPMDHSYPQGPGGQQPIRGENEMHATQDPSRMGQQEVAAEDGGRADAESTLARPVPADLPGGSLQSQQTGGSGPQQGITDSHQRQMEQRSDAWGLLEQPVGHRDKHSGTDVRMHPSEVPPDMYQKQEGTLQDPDGNRQRAAGTGEGTGMAIGPHQNRQGRKP